MGHAAITWESLAPSQLQIFEPSYHSRHAGWAHAFCGCEFSDLWRRELKMQITERRSVLVHHPRGAYNETDESWIARSDVLERSCCLGVVDVSLARFLIGQAIDYLLLLFPTHFFCWLAINHEFPCLLITPP